MKVELFLYSAISLPSLNFPAPSVLLDLCPQGMDKYFCIFPYLIVSVWTSMLCLRFPCPTGHGRQEKPKKERLRPGIEPCTPDYRPNVLPLHYRNGDIQWHPFMMSWCFHDAFDDILIHHDLYLQKTSSPKICTPRAWTSKVGFFLNSAPQKVHVYQVSDF